MGMGQNFLKTLLVWAYQGTMYYHRSQNVPKTNGLKMYQGQFWANFRRGDSEKVSEPEADGRPFLAGVDGGSS